MGCRHSVPDTNEPASPTLTSRLVASNRDQKWYDVYRKERVLGTGITGEVAVVKKRDTDKLYAMKSVNLKKIDPQQLQELRNEVDILRHLNHPGIVHLYETYETDKEIHLIMELCTGGELYDRLREKKYDFTEERVAKIVERLLKALAYCHEKRIVHRDIKPQNVVFANSEPDADIKLIDFGLSKLKNLKSGAWSGTFGKRELQTACGTPLYIAPEVLQRDYDEKIDIWAVGAMMYHMLCGRHPFRAQDQDATLELIENHKKCDFRGKKWKPISDEAKDLLDHLLHPESKNRYSAQEALDHDWFRARLSKEPLDPSILSNICNFAKYSQLKKLAVMAIAHTLAPDEIRDLEKAFYTVDKTRNGSIEKEELREVIVEAQNNGYKISVDQLDLLFEAADADRTGRIQYQEFLAAALDTKKYMNKESLRVAFNVIDTDHSGKISVENLHCMLSDSFSNEEIRQILEESDIRKNGVIDFDEFVIMMEDNVTKRRNSAVQLVSPKRVALEGISEEDDEVGDSNSTEKLEGFSLNDSAEDDGEKGAKPNENSPSADDGQGA